jgi:Subtilisin inhibitor-like
MGRSDSEDEREGPGSGTTSLEISVTPGGEAPTRIWTLRCPDGGTLPNASEACRRLSKLKDPFAPVPKGVACTAIYGGPQEAEVTGVFRGRRVNATFNRGDGCQIARWDRVSFLFPEA